MAKTMWRKSSRSNLYDCVEVAPGSLRTWVRDSKNPGVVLSVTGEDWADLICAVRSGELVKP